MTDVSAMIEELAACIKPKAEQTADQAMKACSVVLERYAKDAGYKPKKEVGYHPAADRWFGRERAAVASWECGPPMWGIEASQQLTRRSGRTMETYYGFDLHMSERQ